MASFFSALKRIYDSINPAPVPKSSNPVKWGILGAANIAPMAFITPARTHPEVEVYGIAARDIDRARAFAKKHGIPKVYGGYQELLDDPDIQAVYNPLPNSLHYEWTMKALSAGKHVLLEKPAANTTEETKEMFEFAKSKGLVLLEAFHYRFHPAIHRARAIIESGELGPVRNIRVDMLLPLPFPDNDIRFNYPLGGGGVMDMGCYTISCTRYLSLLPLDGEAEVLSVTSELFKPKNATVTTHENKIDRKTTATFSLPNDVTATISCDISQPIMAGLPKLHALVECEKGSLEVVNFVMPTLYHSITVKKTDGKAMQKRTEKVYKPSDRPGQVWWTTYRYQLEAFMDRVMGRTPAAWVEPEDSVANMRLIEKVYEKNGLGVRPKSGYVHS